MPQLKDFFGLGDGIHQRLDIKIRDVFFLVAQRLELGEQPFGDFFRQAIAQGGEPLQKGVPPRVLAQHDVVLRDAHILGGHDLVSLPVLQDAMLMDAGFMREGVRADDGLVGRDGLADDPGQMPAGPENLAGLDAGLGAVAVAPGLERHDDLF